MVITKARDRVRAKRNLCSKIYPEILFITFLFLLCFIYDVVQIDKTFFFILTNIDDHLIEGPTGAILCDLPSPYQSHPFGLLHLPRFIGKIRKHLKDELPKSYQRNFTKGFDGFLCLHLGVEPKDVIECVRSSGSDEELNSKLKDLFPNELNPHVWNRKVVQMGMSDMALEKLEEIKSDLGAENRTDLRSFADVIDYDEKRIE